MKVGLIDIEPKIFNTAYMQIATYHKSRGDEVEWWSPLTDSQFDVIYCSSLFDFTNKREIPYRAICGGTGFDVTSRLSRYMEESKLDYSIYPNCKTSFIWFSRGCIRQCSFCVVHKKEGDIHPVQPKNFNPNGEYITVMDNNFFANKLWPLAIDTLLRWGKAVDIQQGIDIRILTQEMALSLTMMKHQKQIRFAWDNPKEKLLPKIEQLLQWIPAWKLMCYVLIGFQSTPEEDLYRIMALRDLKIDPFVMPYNPKDIYQKQFARWVNHKAIFKKVKWQDYTYGVMQQEAAGCGWMDNR